MSSGRAEHMLALETGSALSYAVRRGEKESSGAQVLPRREANSPLATPEPFREITEVRKKHRL